MDNLLAFLIKFKSSFSSIAPFFFTNAVNMQNNFYIILEMPYDKYYLFNLVVKGTTTEIV